MKMNELMNFYSNKKGLTFVEVISGTAIIMIGLVAMLTSTIALLGAARFNKNYLIASQLAREALEVIKKERDEFILQGAGVTFVDWLNSIKSTNPAYQIITFDNGGGNNPFNGKFKLANLGEDLNTCTATGSCEVNFFDSSGEGVYGNGVMSANAGNPTIFFRIITFKDILCEAAVPSAAVGATGLCNSGEVVGVEVTANAEWLLENAPLKGVETSMRLYGWQ